MAASHYDNRTWFFAVDHASTQQQNSLVSGTHTVHHSEECLSTQRNVRQNMDFYQSYTFQPSFSTLG